MFSKALTQSISLLMLLIVALGTTTSAIGEFRSHSLTTISVIDINHSHSHSSSHSHAVDDEFPLHHDASSHNHSYDSATIRLLYHFVLMDMIVVTHNIISSGTPIHKPFQIERPPKVLLFT